MRIDKITSDALYLVLKAQIGEKYGAVTDAARRWNINVEILRRILSRTQDPTPEVMEKAGIVLVPFAIKPPESPSGDVESKVLNWATENNLPLTKEHVRQLAVIFYGEE